MRDHCFISGNSIAVGQGAAFFSEPPQASGAARQRPALIAFRRPRRGLPVPVPVFSSSPLPPAVQAALLCEAGPASAAPTVPATRAARHCADRRTAKHRSPIAGRPHRWLIRRRAFPKTPSVALWRAPNQRARLPILLPAAYVLFGSCVGLLKGKDAALARAVSRQHRVLVRLRHLPPRLILPQHSQTSPRRASLGRLVKR